MGRDLPALRRAGLGRAAHPRSTSASPTPRWPERPTRSSIPSSTTTIDLGPAGARRRRARAARWRRCAGTTAPACAPSAGPTATRATAAALPHATPGGLTSTCSGSRSSRPAPSESAVRPNRSLETRHGRPEEEEVQGQGPQPPGRRRGGWAARRAACARTARPPRRPTWSAPAAAGTRVAKPSRSTDLSRRGERPSPETLATLPVAVDAMGGDKAPGEIVEGARRAAERARRRRSCWSARPTRWATPGACELVPCTEVIGMDEDPAGGVRRKKDSSLVRAAELVRDGKASAMVSAGNTGATMASRPAAHGAAPRRGAALHRHAAAAPGPHPGRAGRRRRQRRVHAGHAGAVRPDGRRLRLRPLRHRVAHGRPAVHRRGAHQGHAAGQGDPRPAGRGGTVGRRRGFEFVGQPRGPGPAALAGRRRS